MNRKLLALPLLTAFAIPVAAWPGNVAGASDPPAVGRTLFQQHCGGCHLAGGFGTRVLARRVGQDQAPLEARSAINPDLVKLVVRRGLGAMPQIRRTELNDRDLAAIAQYLEAGQ